MMACCFCRQRALFQKALQLPRMSSKATTHLERTADVIRSKIVSEAEVKQIENISPTVKRLNLKIKNNEFSFLAGQWVDFIIPNLETVGGFSMCSSPAYLDNTRMLDLAVKVSPHPPAQWVHKKCKIGDTVLLKVGGSCVWSPENSSLQKNTLLIAGGIGINPILSILLNIEETRAATTTNFGRSVLLYSASTNEELIFKDKLDSLCSGSEMLSCKYFITKETSKEPTIVGKRISKSDILEAVKTLTNGKGIQCFLCGPPPMIKTMLVFLRDAGLESSSIHYEQWW